MKKFHIHTAKSAARRLRLSQESMRKYAPKYKVGSKPGRDWLFTEEDLDTLRRRPPRGRPRIEK